MINSSEEIKSRLIIFKKGEDKPSMIKQMSNGERRVKKDKWMEDQFLRRNPKNN